MTPIAQQAPGAVDVAWLIPLFPAVGAVTLLAFGRRFKRAAGPFATAMMLGALTVGATAFFQVLALPEGSRSFVQRIATWFSVGTLEVSYAYRIDQLSLVMILVVTGIGSLIHLYSYGYMKGDPREPRYFAYLNLFAASMLVLVLANNFVLLFLGWELVGLSSYLLIGFWFDREGVGTAAKKAFVTNRVGDLAFLIGIFLIFATFGSVDFDTVFGGAEEALATGTATAIALLLFAGAAGKSAQIPLYVWLPDAMAGPTPVSALIHAATMVTAGIYLLVRSAVFFEISTVALDVVAGIGIATAILAGLIAIVQDDIKKVLAYSTVSQLGLMFVAVGVGAYAVGIFHLVTHAFFKALLFLGAGSVMHALGDRTDITQMGGLWRKIPWTMATFVMGWLAIIGFPGTSGFFSKDQILESAYAHEDYVIWGLGLLVTVITAFYMTRLVMLTFFGRRRLDPSVHPHESPVSMVFPLVVLGLGALFAGLINVSPGHGRLVGWLAPIVGGKAGGEHAAAGLSAFELSAIATLAALAGATLAFVMYGTRAYDWQGRRERPSFAWRAARNRFGVDDAYQFVFTSVGRLFASALAFVVDLKIIDGVVNGVGNVTARAAALGRKAQTGLVRSYAVGVLGGAVLVLALLLGRTLD